MIAFIGAEGFRGVGGLDCQRQPFRFSAFFVFDSELHSLNEAAFAGGEGAAGLCFAVGAHDVDVLAAADEPEGLKIRHFFVFFAFKHVHQRRRQAHVGAG
ncbi:hypothetical protein SDC9_200066 [bioreactor metagenome]|uniref:Uncharacterized protein n=1 Tax=bioreactor metagenome TaxID=1076179 RepID=A0A645IM57_9ZZZZ